MQNTTIALGETTTPDLYAPAAAPDAVMVRLSLGASVFPALPKDYALGYVDNERVYLLLWAV